MGEGFGLLVALAMFLLLTVMLFVGRAQADKPRGATWCEHDWTMNTDFPRIGSRRSCSLCGQEEHWWEDLMHFGNFSQWVVDVEGIEK